MMVPTAKLATMLSAVVRSVRIHIGTTGSAARSSTSTKTTVPTTAPPTMTAVCHDAHGKRVPAKESHRRRSVTARTTMPSRRTQRLWSSPRSRYPTQA